MTAVSEVLTVETLAETWDHGIRHRITGTPGGGPLTWWETAGPAGAAVITVRADNRLPVAASIHRAAPVDINTPACDFTLTGSGCQYSTVPAAHLDRGGGWDVQTAVSGLEPWWTLTNLYVAHLIERRPL